MYYKNGHSAVTVDGSTLVSGSPYCFVYESIGLGQGLVAKVTDVNRMDHLVSLVIKTLLC